MTIIRNIVPPSLYPLKATYPMVAEEICIHNTASDASAVNEIAYVHRNPDPTSYHFAVDDIQAVQGLPLDRNGWHAGDGLNGRGNRKSIGIEICYSKSGGPRFKQAEKNAAKLTAQLLKERGWGIERVKKHQDYSGKYCPHRTLSETGWANFLAMVQAELTEASGGGNNSKPFIAQGADGLYRIQLGAFSVKANAENELRRITALLDGKTPPQFTPTTPPKPSYKNFTVGERVVFRDPSAPSIYSGASEGVAVPYSVKLGTYTVQQIQSNGTAQTKLLLQEIQSWVYGKDMR